MNLSRSLCAVIGLLAHGAIASDSVLIFNEVQYHPADELTQTEWVELRSLQAVDVDIGKWRIEGGISYTFAEGTVMPGGGYLVIAANPGAIPGSLGPFTGQLDNGGEAIRLVNRNGRVMDALASHRQQRPDGMDDELEPRRNARRAKLSGLRADRSHARREPRLVEIPR